MKKKVQNCQQIRLFGDRGYQPQLGFGQSPRTSLTPPQAKQLVIKGSLKGSQLANGDFHAFMLSKWEEWNRAIGWDPSQQKWTEKK